MNALLFYNHVRYQAYQVGMKNASGKYSRAVNCIVL